MGIVRDLASVHGADRAAVDSCQRLEYYGIGSCRCDAPRRLHGREALQHLAEVAAGLHSAELGEDQVMGQVRDAISGARGDLQLLATVAVSAAREFRRNEEFDTDSGRLLDRALDLGGVRPVGALLVLGAGRMGRLVAARGVALGFESIVVASRRPPEAAWLAQVDANWIPLLDLADAEPVEVAVGCLGASADPVDPATELPPVRTLLVDLGTPRNFARSEESGIPVVTIASIIGARPPGEEALRLRSATRLATTIDARLADVASDGASPLGRLRKNIEATRHREAARLAAANPGLDPSAIDALTRSLVNRLFHRPTEALRNEPQLAAAFADLFEPDPGELD